MKFLKNCEYEVHSIRLPACLNFGRCILSTSKPTAIFMITFGLLNNITTANNFYFISALSLLILFLFFSYPFLPLSHSLTISFSLGPTHTKANPNTCPHKREHTLTFWLYLSSTIFSNIFSFWWIYSKMLYLKELLLRLPEGKLRL